MFLDARQEVKMMTVLMNWIREQLRAANNRRELRDLAELEPRLLEDMGVSRRDLDAALSSPLGRSFPRAQTTACCHWRTFKGFPPAASTCC
jgi:uncharacterized protein YjiS (DUF1127 family)